jgi:hypothetical protein
MGIPTHRQRKEDLRHKEQILDLELSPND